MPSKSLQCVREATPSGGYPYCHHKERRTVWRIWYISVLKGGVSILHGGFKSIRSSCWSCRYPDRFCGRSEKQRLLHVFLVQKVKTKNYVIRKYTYLFSKVLLLHFPQGLSDILQCDQEIFHTVTSSSRSTQRNGTGAPHKPSDICPRKSTR